MKRKKYPLPYRPSLSEIKIGSGAGGIDNMESRGSWLGGSGGYTLQFYLSIFPPHLLSRVSIILHYAITLEARFPCEPLLPALLIAHSPCSRAEQQQQLRAWFSPAALLLV